MRYSELTEAKAGLTDTMLELIKSLDLSNLDNMVKSLQRADRSAVKQLSDYLSDEEAKRLAKIAKGRRQLFHGAPQIAAEKIKANGFALTKGRRTGFLGSIDEVDNQGIFLTDSKHVARYFGQNRTDDTFSSAQLITCYVDTSKFLDVTNGKLPAKVNKLARQWVDSWHGKDQKITQDVIWQLFDQKYFVDGLKEMGITGAIFKETVAVRREAGDMDALTYFVFDPKSIKVYRAATLGDTFNTLCDIATKHNLKPESKEKAVG